MSESEIRCSLLAFLIARHAYGNPLPKEVVVNRAGIRSDQVGQAKDVFEDLRDANFIEDCGARGIQLDNDKFGALADYLYHECGWSEIDLKIKLKHYEGWDEHEWTSR